MTQVDPLALLIWIVIIAVSFIVVLVKVCCSVKWLRVYQRDRYEKIKSLRIHRMLGSLGIKLSRYLRKVPPSDVERQLLVCEWCKTTKTCDTYLEGCQTFEEQTFCPNFPEFERYKKSNGV
jgi:hypothetical protein